MTAASGRVRTVILGAAGRDFHNFNVVYRHDPSVEVVAFTAAQIPGIGGRRYPPALAGPLYPAGIPIADEAGLEALIARGGVAQVVFAYSDVTHEAVMHLASRALAAGADFALLGPGRTMIEGRRPVIAVSAVRTGCGKSQTSRWISRRLAARGLAVGVIRHPMPYGDLERQAVQRFATRADLDVADCTVEEREEYEPHLAAGNVVYAGVDYARILAAAEREADLVLWDGGNNDFPFIRPDLHVVIADALRPGHETTHHPGETTLRMADVVVVNKVDSARPEDIARVEEAVRAANPRALVVRAASPARIAEGAAIGGRRALVIEDGPTLTHGGMAFGAGFVAATRAGAEVIDPRPYAAPEIAAVFAAHPHIGRVLPAVGYGEAQLAALGQTIERAEADLVVTATPADLGRLIRISKPVVRVVYEFAEAGEPSLGAAIDAFLARLGVQARGRGR
ncbi:MAG: GTPase [Proteobacteria bacterium]|nr:GTPase [Pseudomonadota bacterium]